MSLKIFLFNDFLVVKIELPYKYLKLIKFYNLILVQETNKTWNNTEVPISQKV